VVVIVVVIVIVSTIVVIAAVALIIAWVIVVIVDRIGGVAGICRGVRIGWVVLVSVLVVAWGECECC
jgi:hypothetical protein